MTLWRISSRPGSLSDDEKATLNTTITNFYTQRGVPSFYVIILFNTLEQNDVHTGDTYLNPNLVRITVEQKAPGLSAGVTDDEAEARTRLVAPLFQNLDRDLEVLNKQRLLLGESEVLWEISVKDIPRERWQIQGLRTPAAKV
ncbi:hypothetical protein PMZ80_007615 [Knufia obscura]|uniref:Tautomerase cis-CaaD-like domain-containing protein n=2 Tax=Knufia TaxID=430999 RepID=A0AAN8ING9_9EURO|nr:hypothetical protein PMZ80_007615 [Knufia obscura]KAK5954157.1 hypothetical protein OHC33_004730 [Knufia fluminis]